MGILYAHILIFTSSRSQISHYHDCWVAFAFLKREARKKKEREKGQKKAKEKKTERKMETNCTSEHFLNWSNKHLGARTIRLRLWSIQKKFRCCTDVRSSARQP
ncbi:uncharacterized protein BP01DRAFT_158925 [Aspergillus saccharolyticus JOP 1030-1]|uniref:Uncharacterized protein n=1 Tax=Aspergillus saccharolyticus JOP 1030-1 TaxID=1450539 RepID=A0A318Z615_9EURO|nr:hypothetical protein BP01DRAFT_158925 [Aspergillus saccharolyticus JOP 1030-1]PYH41817.1 hypothetical protein BP01DRAFT_158925 [Aspergillus saccharolyticus JOP 1030-1]